jgi:NAD(P)-dependent dehydrogenase (short-subunit alcohol dehydrogenase family)
MAAFGRVDIVVNNAGASQTGPFMSITDEVWQGDLDLKLFAAIRLTRHAWPQMVERRWGRVINVLNIGAKAPKAASSARRSLIARRTVMRETLLAQNLLFGQRLPSLEEPTSDLISEDKEKLTVQRHPPRGETAMISVGQRFGHAQHPKFPNDATAIAGQMFGVDFDDCDFTSAKCTVNKIV